MRLWEITDNRIVPSVQFGGRAEKIGNDFVGNDVILTCDSVVKAWSTQSGASWLWEITPRTGSAAAVRVSPDEKRLAILTDDNQIELWDYATRKWLKTFDEKTSKNVTDMLWSPDSNYIACTNYRGRYQAWEIESGDSLLDDSVTAEYTGQIAWSPDSSELLTSHYGGKKQFWDVRKRTLARSYISPSPASLWLARSNTMIGFDGNNRIFPDGPCRWRCGDNSAACARQGLDARVCRDGVFLPTKRG